MATLVEEAGKKRSQVYEALRELEDHGIVQRVARYRPDGGRMSSEYILAWAEEPPMPDAQMDLGFDGDPLSGFPDGGADSSGRPDDQTDPPVQSPGHPPSSPLDPMRSKTGREEEQEEAIASSAPRTVGHKVYVSALVDAVGGGRPLSENRMGQVLKAAKQLRSMGADPAVVADAWQAGLARFEGRLTPIGLVDNWWSLSGTTSNGKSRVVELIEQRQRERSAS